MKLKAFFLIIVIKLFMASCSNKNNSTRNINTIFHSINFCNKKENAVVFQSEVFDTTNYEKLRTNFKQNKLTKLNIGEIYSQEFQNGDLIESYKYLGTINCDNQIYRVYSFFKKIMLANGYRGQTRILFLGMKEMFSYPNNKLFSMLVLSKSNKLLIYSYEIFIV